MNSARIDNKYMTLIRRFPLVPIHNKNEFKIAIQIMKELAYRAKDLSRAESDYLSVLGDLIAQYEKRLNLPQPKVSPVEALEYLMEMSGRTQAELALIIGHKSNLSAFLHGKRGLSKANAMRLAQYFKVSPALFLDSTTAAIAVVSKPKTA